ncbi:unnamed protein product [Trifolium pratense]|uniref:Uncharacterized protein n=1 Tax=Trifolium pratense TaxID=57577 RepID=A0ACB0J3G3_TRIPR|nr:unnamed protein product [Trifolium pratense]
MVLVQGLNQKAARMYWGSFTVALRTIEKELTRRTWMPLCFYNTPSSDMLLSSCMLYPVLQFSLHKQFHHL